MSGIKLSVASSWKVHAKAKTIYLLIVVIAAVVIALVLSSY